MKQVERIWLAGILGLIIATATGCPDTAPPDGPSNPPEGVTDPSGNGTATSSGTPTDAHLANGEDTPTEPIVLKGPPPEEPLPDTYPEVNLTETQEAALRVRAGEAFPDAELSDLLAEGSLRVSELLGSRATVVLFWTGGETEFSGMAATAALKDLEKDVLGEFGSAGASVVAINVGQPAATGVKLATESQATYPILSDADGAFFAQIATETLPRIYLLDSEGRILWFDIEYSSTTRRSLADGLHLACKQE